MTNTIANVPRELLERARAAVASTNNSNWSSDLLRDIHAILSAPSPAGVDGLEVVGYRCWFKKEPWNIMCEWGARAPEEQNPSSAHEELCRLSDAQAIIDGLRGEVAAQRVKTCAALKARNDAHEERDQQAQRIGELEGMLRSCLPALSDGGCAALANRIDAALSAGKEGE